MPERSPDPSTEALTITQESDWPKWTEHFYVEDGGHFIYRYAEERLILVPESLSDALAARLSHAVEALRELDTLLEPLRDLMWLTGSKSFHPGKEAHAIIVRALAASSAGEPNE